MRKGLMIVTVLLAGASVAAAGTSKDEMKRVTDASRVLREISAAPDKNIPESIWQRARCVAVMPDVKKAAFVVGGEYGKGSDELQDRHRLECSCLSPAGERQLRRADWCGVD